MGQRSLAEMLLTTSSIAEQSTTDIIFFNHLVAALCLHSFNWAVQLNEKSLKKLFWLELYQFSYELINIRSGVFVDDEILGTWNRKDPDAQP